MLLGKKDYFAVRFERTTIYTLGRNVECFFSLFLKNAEITDQSYLVTEHFSLNLKKKKSTLQMVWDFGWKLSFIIRYVKNKSDQFVGILFLRIPISNRYHITSLIKRAVTTVEESFESKFVFGKWAYLISHCLLSRKSFLPSSL